MWGPGLWRSRWRVPFIPQMEASECGAASLAMVLAFHGHEAPLAEVRQACGVSRDGVNVDAVLRAAEAYGLEGVAVRLEVEDVGALPLPAIIHWDFRHFVVLESVGKDGVRLIDPEMGRRTVALSEMAQRFTGIALILGPSASFEKRPGRRPSLRRYWEKLRGVLPNLHQIVGASVAYQAVGMALPLVSQWVIDRVILPGQGRWLGAVGVGFSLALVGRALMGVVRSWVAQNLQRSLDEHLMEEFVGHLLRLPLGFFLQRRIGDLVQRVRSNTEIRNVITSRSITSILDGVLVLGYLVLMFRYSVPLGAVVLVAALMRLGLTLGLKQAVEQSVIAELSGCGREGAALLEAFSTLETTKASRAEARVLNRWYNRLVERTNASLGRRSLEILGARSMVFLQGSVLGAVLWIGGGHVLTGRMSLGAFAAFLALQGLFIPPLEAMVEALGQFQYLGGHLRRLDDVLETAGEASGVRVLGPILGRIELDEVSFAYSPKAPPIVQGVSVVVRPGEKVALVGPSGSGKSTLARLMLGLHLPGEGCVRLDGHDLRDLDLPALRRRCGVLLQEVFLFDGTVRDNLRLNAPGLGLDRLREAARMACIDDEIMALPEGYDTRIGENGNRLSGGQRQRLGLARALAHTPSLLMLDEVTSALDLPTEARVHANLAELGCTRVVIAHRLETVRDADRILVVQGGRVVQEGTFPQLVAAPGLFQDLARAAEGGL